MANKPTRKKSAKKKAARKTTDKEEVRKMRADAEEALKTAQEEGKVVDLPVPSNENDVKSPVTLVLDELFQYKLKVLTRELEDAKANVIAPLRDLYQRELSAKAKAAVAADPKCQEAYKKHVECVNHLLDTISSALPEGYAVSQINPDDGNITAEYDPQKVDQRLSEVLK